MAQFTFVREARLYHADQETVEMLKAVQKWDDCSEHNVGQDVFARGLENGRIHEGPALAVGQTKAHDQTPAHAARHDGAESSASPTRRASAQAFEIGE
jgi:hypothetical protein